jgi:5-aminopentanamidase
MSQPRRSDVPDGTSPVRIACCQIGPRVTSPETNAVLTTAAIKAAVDAGAQIILLPELASSGYVFQSAEEARTVAVRADGDLLHSWAAEAARGQAIIVGGFCELAADSRVFNSAALIDPEGVRTVYRKLHLWHNERRWFSPGENPAPVVETRYGRIGLAVCYDLEFPELTRGLALQGADLVAAPTNWPHHPNRPNGRPILHSLATTTGYLNKVFVAVCDRCGTERGLHFEGGSVIAGPSGALHAGPVADRRACMIVADCELTRARDKRLGPDNDVFADRRPEHYLAPQAAHATHVV